MAEILKGNNMFKVIPENTDEAICFQDYIQGFTVFTSYLGLTMVYYRGLPALLTKTREKAEFIKSEIEKILFKEKNGIFQKVEKSKRKNNI